MDDIASLDEVNLRLAEIQGELWDLADDDYGTRYDLKLEQDRLRAVSRKLADPDDTDPPTS